MNVFREYADSVKFIRSVYDSLPLVDCETLADLRGYGGGSAQRALINDLNLGYCTGVYGSADWEKYGLLRNGEFLLNDRYIIPVEDTGGNLCAMIGYYPDAKRYVTTPTPFFSKECLLFNFRHAYELAWNTFNGCVLLVEGIFDTLSLSSLGLPAVGAMGATVTKYQGYLLRSFRKVVSIPDADETGYKAFGRWSVPAGSLWVRLKPVDIDVGGVRIRVKDMDDFVKVYGENDVREFCFGLFNSDDTVVEV